MYIYKYVFKCVYIPMSLFEPSCLPLIMNINKNKSPNNSTHFHSEPFISISLTFSF